MGQRWSGSGWNTGGKDIPLGGFQERVDSVRQNLQCDLTSVRPFSALNCSAAGATSSSDSVNIGRSDT